MSDDQDRSTNLERENRILDAAKALILHYGFDKTTVSEIARDAGVSKGAIYLHFDSKEAIIDHLLTREVGAHSDRIITRLEQDTSNWSFVGMYQHAVKEIHDADLLRAYARGDSRVFGSYFQKSSVDFLHFKQQTGYSLLKAMQEVGALRQDLDMRSVAYILALLGQGMFYGNDNISPEHQVSLEDYIQMLGEMLERWLVPENGGNREAGRAIILQMIQAARQQMDTFNNNQKG